MASGGILHGQRGPSVRQFIAEDTDVCPNLLEASVYTRLHAKTKQVMNGTKQGTVFILQHGPRAAHDTFHIKETNQ
jgi:hypothetical protein